MDLHTSSTWEAVVSTTWDLDDFPFLELARRLSFCSPWDFLSQGRAPLKRVCRPLLPASGVEDCSSCLVEVAGRWVASPYK